MEVVNLVLRKLTSAIDDFTSKSSDIEVIRKHIQPGLASLESATTAEIDLIRKHVQPVLVSLESATTACATEVARLVTDRKIVDADVARRLTELSESLNRMSTDSSKGPTIGLDLKLSEIQQLLSEVRDNLNLPRPGSKWSWFTGRSGK
jgi:hypothetical protein